MFEEGYVLVIMDKDQDKSLRVKILQFDFLDVLIDLKFCLLNIVDLYLLCHSIIISSNFELVILREHLRNLHILQYFN
jgi:hypothetical protein